MKERWIERGFVFDLPVERFPCVLERVRGTPARVEELVRDIPPSVLTRRDGDRWSIQENVGHLVDLDELHTGRLNDYEVGATVLRPADQENKKTWAANHNARPVDALLRALRHERGLFVARLEKWDEARLGQAALHPRLQKPMRVLDLAFFVAEHDDYHLARMRELLRLFGFTKAEG